MAPSVFIFGPQNMNVHTTLFALFMTFHCEKSVDDFVNLAEEQNKLFAHSNHMPCIHYR